LLDGLHERGLDTTRPIFVGIDGAKALRTAVLRVFDHPVIGRCQLHYADLGIMSRWMVCILLTSCFELGRSA
jgi:hypothetical protein